jgi:hypothetical protein
VIDQSDNEHHLDAIKLNYHDIYFKRDKIKYESLFTDFYCAAFQAQRKKYKKKFKISTEDQVSYYFEGLFLLGLQFILCSSLLTSGEIPVKILPGWDVHVAAFFAMCLLHLPCTCLVRNGMQMCKLVTYHSDEFTNPTAMFIYSFLVMLVHALCEVTNAISLLHQPNITEVIARFVCFKIMIQINDYYLRQRSNF